MGYKFFASTLALIIFTYVVLAPGMGEGGEVFVEDWNVSEEDITFTPEQPDASPEAIDLSDTYERENITIIEDEDLEDNNLTDYETERAVVRENGKSSGYVIYNTPGISYLETKTTKTGFLESSGVSVEFLDASFDELATFDTSGEDTGSVDSETEYIRVNLEEDKSALYELSYSEFEPGGIVDTIYGYIIGFLSFPLKLWTVLSQLPLPVQLFYGGMLTWAIIDILQVG